MVASFSESTSSSCRPRSWRSCAMIWWVSRRSSAATSITTPPEGEEEEETATRGGSEGTPLRAEAFKVDEDELRALLFGSEVAGGALYTARCALRCDEASS